MIKLRCGNQECAYCYEVTEKELQDNPQYHVSCPMCGSLLIVKLEDIVAHDLDQQAEAYLKKWFRELGLEGTVELIERSPRNKVRELYMKKLKEKGLIK